MILTLGEIIFDSLFSGIIATAVMTLSEIPSWRKWGLPGVFEWHENQILSARFFRFPRNKPSFKFIFFLHFANGSLAAIAYPLILSILNISIRSDHIYNIVLALAYGLVLWSVTLVPIHKPITGYPVWNHYLGHLPLIVSVVGHLIYGLVLGVLMTILLRH
jgi:hypothetical protein